MLERPFITHLHSAWTASMRAEPPFAASLQATPLQKNDIAKIERSFKFTKAGFPALMINTDYKYRVMATPEASGASGLRRFRQNASQMSSPPTKPRELLFAS